jgi:general secretion pathway protein J
VKRLSLNATPALGAAASTPPREIGSPSRNTAAWRPPLQSRNAGFTLLEMMLALALTGVMVSAIAVFAGQWMTSWRAGFAQLQATDLLSLGLERLSADISAAQYGGVNSGQEPTLFLGDAKSLIFIRRSPAPDTLGRLEVVRIAQTSDARGAALIRSRAPYFPLAPGTPVVGLRFADPVAIVRAPFVISFAYADAGRVWRDSWGLEKALPAAVRVTVRTVGRAEVVSASTAITLHVTGRLEKSNAKAAPDAAGAGTAATGAASVGAGGAGTADAGTAFK